MSEHNQQKAVINWFKVKYPKFAGCLFAIPNGTYLSGDSKRRGQQMNKLKSEGFKPGVSDLFLAVPKHGFCGLWIEMKDIKKKIKSVSDSQMEHLTLMDKMGYGAIWCSGSQQAIDTITSYIENGECKLNKGE